MNCGEIVLLLPRKSMVYSYVLIPSWYGVYYKENSARQTIVEEELHFSWSLFLLNSQNLPPFCSACILMLAKSYLKILVANVYYTVVAV